MIELNNLLVPSDFAGLYAVLSVIITLVILVASILSIILVLLQPSKSDGINSITGSSETFYGKNKGQSIEEKMKKWTIICLVVIGVLSIVFFVLQFSGLWE